MKYDEMFMFILFVRIYYVGLSVTITYARTVQ